jgi:uncharacterized ferritin-like protein (DUF455 family)
VKTSLFAALAAALSSREIEQKLALTAAIKADWQEDKLDWQDASPINLTCGLPARPELIPPQQVPHRGVKSQEGRARLLHAIVHIEFSAINLALDHAARFRGMPKQYYADWIGVAADEAYHFTLLRQRLQGLGHDYGDFPAHAGLWEMAERTTGDVLARMALVPRLLEARGLDATPPIQKRLIQSGDHETAALLDIILRDEISHVGLGDSWFRRLCKEQQIEPESTFRRLLSDFNAPRPLTPMNETARLAAGFTKRELAALLEIE